MLLHNPSPIIRYTLLKMGDDVPKLKMRGMNIRRVVPWNYLKILIN